MAQLLIQPRSNGRLKIVLGVASVVAALLLAALYLSSKSLVTLSSVSGLAATTKVSVGSLTLHMGQCDCSQCPVGAAAAAAGGNGSSVGPQQHSNTSAVTPGVSSSSQYNEAIMQRLWEYQPFLPPRSLRQGVHSLGEGSRLRRFTHKLLSGQPVSFSAVGGSVTAGQGAIHGQPYVKRIWDWIKQVSPKADHVLKHGAFGGSTSGIFTVCIRDMVQADVDVVLVEFAVNDVKTTGDFRNPSRLGYERLLRKLLEFDNRPAVVLMNHYAWFTSGGGRDQRGDYLSTAENDFNVIGQYYGMPLLSVRSAAYQLMMRRVKGYQAHTWFRDHEQNETEANLYYYDELHPQDGTGHRAMADLFITLVRQAALDLQQRPLGPEDEEIAKEALPEPMVPGNLQRRSSTCLLQRNFEKVVTAQQGFVWKNERPGAEYANEKWGWISDTPNSWAELQIDTTTALQGELKSDSNEVVLTYLKSYEHMGKAKVACVANCNCTETTLDGYWEQQASLTELHRFQASPHKECKLRVTVLSESSSPDQGKKVKLVGVMVVEGGHKVEAIGIQLDLFANRGDKEEAMRG